MKLEFTDIRKILKYQISWKSVQLEPSYSMRTNGTGRHDEANSCFSQFCERAWNLYYSIACCNYTYFQHFIKLGLRCLIKNCIILLHCFIKGFLMTFGQLYLRQSFATRSRCLTQLHYAHSQVTNRGTNRIPVDRGRKWEWPFSSWKVGN